MSEANVALVLSVHPDPETNIVEFFHRDDEGGADEAMDAVRAFFTEDYVCIFHGLSDYERPGIEGLREAWLDWLEPWASYKTSIEEMRDEGPCVLAFVKDIARRHGQEESVVLRGAAVYTIRDGRFARMEHFADRRQAEAAFEAGAREGTGAA